MINEWISMNINEYQWPIIIDHHQVSSDSHFDNTNASTGNQCTSDKTAAAEEDENSTVTSASESSTLGKSCSKAIRELTLLAVVAELATATYQQLESAMNSGLARMKILGVGNEARLHKVYDNPIDTRWLGGLEFQRCPMTPKLPRLYLWLILASAGISKWHRTPKWPNSRILNKHFLKLT